jgi:hypothetical protein
VQAFCAARAIPRSSFSKSYIPHLSRRNILRILSGDRVDYGYGG